MYANNQENIQLLGHFSRFYA